MSDLKIHANKHRETTRELLNNLEGPIPHWINGAFESTATSSFPANNPFLNEAFADVADAGNAGVDKAVAAARTAQSEWAKTPPRQRAKALQAIAGALRAQKKQLTAAEALNVGVPKMISSRFSIAAMIRHYEYYAEWADKVYGEVVPSGADNVLDYTLREPHGVVATITAWNTPSLFMGSKIAPALAAGNTVVLKPSERAPLSALLLARAVQQAELPPGVLNIVHGGAETGSALTTHPDVDMLTFTGGTEIGRKIAQQAALKPTCLELGGKSAAIVLEDADINKAVFALVGGAFALSGQACAAASRLLVHRKVYDQFVTQFKTMSSMMVLGDPLDGATVQGPLISPAQLERTLNYIEQGKKDGGEVLLGGNMKDDGLFANGNFVEPTLLQNVPPDSRVAQEEIFGPVCCIFPFDEIDEAVAMANASDFGLAGGVWTKSISKAHRIAASIRAGYIWVNAYGNIPNTTPFGGYGASGHGREGGREGILEFTRLKNVFVQL